MKNLLKVALLALGLSTLGGCAMAAGGSNSVSGFIYSGYSSGGVVGNGTGTKTGQACATNAACQVDGGDSASGNVCSTSVTPSCPTRLGRSRSRPRCARRTDAPRGRRGPAPPPPC